jgi:hypothetical protein
LTSSASEGCTSRTRPTTRPCRRCRPP